MESTNRLRLAVGGRYIDGENFITLKATRFYELVGAIEAEIAERYIELPLDADGMPIHTGDMLQLGDTRSDVVALAYRPHDELPWEWLTRGGEWHSTAFARHVKPRTLEDVLNGLVEAVEERGSERVDVENVAAEIRELLRGDAE